MTAAEGVGTGPTPPSLPIHPHLVTFWADQLAEQPAEAREGWLSVLASSHGTAFAERVRELLTQECAA